MRLGDRLVAFPTRKTLALLIYLAVEARLHPREHLAALLWPESNSERSYANLRNTLNRLQTALCQAGSQREISYLHVTPTALGLNPDANIEIDLHTVEQAYALARADRSNRALLKGLEGLPLLQSAVASQRGDFLVGFSLSDAPGFDDWSSIQREAWHRRLGLILDRLSEIQFANGEFAATAETASRWIALDALNETAYRRKMRAHFAAGERGLALDTYEACRLKLSVELGVEPEQDTTALAERIRTQALPDVRRTAAQSRRPDNSFSFLGSLFVGRSSEYQTLVSAYERAAQGQPQLVVLYGDAGIGKTRLAGKFLAWASAQGAGLLQGSAFESGGSHLPFQPLVEALRLRLEGKVSLKDLLGEGSLDDAWISSLSQLMPELNPLDPGLPAAPQAQPLLEEEISQAQLFEAFTQLTLALAMQAPLVLLVDDLQWADRATLDFLRYAILRWREKTASETNAARVLLLVSLRAGTLHPIAQPQHAGGLQGGPMDLLQWLTRVGRELAPVYIELGPLEEADTLQLVESILASPSAEFAQWLYSETRGQPFYLIETLKDLLERRVLLPRRSPDRRWTFNLDAEYDLRQAASVPSSVHAVIRSRLNRLNPNAFNLLVAGAVLEHQITFDRLCALANLGVDPALPALDELINFRLLLEASQPGAASDYIFVNDMLRDVVYTEAGDARRRLFHKRALEILEAAGDSHAALAHHALAAGLAQDAFRHSIAAGREALRFAAFGEAIVHFERARQLVHAEALVEIPAEAELRRLLRWLSRAYELNGQPEKALEIEAERDSLGG